MKNKDQIIFQIAVLSTLMEIRDGVLRRVILDSDCYRDEAVNRLAQIRIEFGNQKPKKKRRQANTHIDRDEEWPIKRAPKKKSLRATDGGE